MNIGTLTEEFDFDLYEALNPSRLKENLSIKKQPGDKSCKIYSNLPNAQSVYESYLTKNIKTVEPKSGDVVDGVVTTLINNTATIDIGWRENIIIDLKKENKDYLKYIKVGLPTQVKIEKVDFAKNGASKGIYGSYSSNIMQKFKSELIEGIGKSIAYIGKVTELIYGGFYIDISGVKCFMPGSLGGINKLNDFSKLLGQNLYVVPVNYSAEKDYVVVSHRDYLKELIPNAVSNLIIGEEYEGVVTGTNKLGIFVEFNECLTGLINKNEMTQLTSDKYDANEINPGDTIKFKVKSIFSNERINLTQNEVQIQVDPWDTVEERYSQGKRVTGTIKKVMPYGIFIEIENGITGLLHKSNLSDDLDLETLQEINVKIKSIDATSRRIVLGL